MWTPAGLSNPQCPFNVPCLSLVNSSLQPVVQSKISSDGEPGLKATLKKHVQICVPSKISQTNSTFDTKYRNTRKIRDRIRHTLGSSTVLHSLKANIFQLVSTMKIH